jgi:hypothetical protein
MEVRQECVIGSVTPNREKFSQHHLDKSEFRRWESPNVVSVPVQQLMEFSEAQRGSPGPRQPPTLSLRRFFRRCHLGGWLPSGMGRGRAR